MPTATTSTKLRFFASLAGSERVEGRKTRAVKNGRQKLENSKIEFNFVGAKFGGG